MQLGKAPKIEFKVLEYVRFAQADRLHGLGWGEDAPFEDYLRDIPPVPVPPKRERFYYPVLVDNRLELWRRCHRLDVGLVAHFRDFDPTPRPPLYWIWCQDGTVNRGRSPEYCRWTLKDGEQGLTADEGIAFHAQYPRVATERFIDLPGSFALDDPRKVACLGPWTNFKDPKGGCAWLSSVTEQERHHACGSATHAR